MMSYVDSLKLDIQQERERANALMAHVERLTPIAHDAWLCLDNARVFISTRQKMHEAGREAHDECQSCLKQALEDTPATSLARLIATKQAEALDSVAMEWRRDEMDQNHTDCVEYVEKKAAALRRQAEGGLT